MEYLPLKATNDFMRNTNEIPRYKDGVLVKEPFVWGASLYHDFFDSILYGLNDPNGPTYPPTEEEFIRFFLTQEFWDVILGKSKKYFCLVMSISLAQMDAYDRMNDEQRKRYAEGVTTEIIDQSTMLFFLNRWVRNKQVIKPDATFAYYLTQTEKLTISKEILEHLPYSSFYIDLSNCRGMFDDALGAFVFVTKLTEGDYSVTFYLVCDEKECAFYSDYLYFYGLDKNSNDVDIANMEENEQAWNLNYTKSGNFDKEHILDKTELKLPNKSIKALILQLLCYMSTEKPDIVPDKEMVHTYHPTPVIKNKFREVFVNEIGYRVGADLLKKKKEVEELYESSEEYQNENPKTRKSPCAHYRKAHWQGYWIGKGRTEYTVKWIEPVFVCGNFSSEAVIHKASMPSE